MSAGHCNGEPVILHNLSQKFCSGKHRKIFFFGTGILRVADYRTTLTFKDIESEIEFKRPWPILRADENSFSNHCYYFSNALELLNRPQEWFNDTETGKVYYWPRSGESVNTIEAIAPVHETLVCIEGDLDRRGFIHLNYSTKKRLTGFYNYLKRSKKGK